MSYKMFLDDERFPVDKEMNEFLIVRTFVEAVKLMETKGCPNYISFDHDLGEGPNGYDLVKWMINKDLDKPGFIPNEFSFYVHSQNPVGKGNIFAQLTRYLEVRDRQ